MSRALGVIALLKADEIIRAIHCGAGGSTTSIAVAGSRAAKKYPRV